MVNRTIQGFLVAFVALFPAVATAQSLLAMRVTGPAEVVGDGATAIQVQVTLELSRPVDLKGLTVEVSAGRVGGVKELTASSLEVTLIPPRVVEEVVLTVVAKSRRGHQGKAEIRVLPDIAPVTMRASNGPLALQVPEHLILGYHKEGFVSFQGGSLSPIKLYASAGTISSAEPDRGDRYGAIYTPPTGRLPRVVLIVAATEDGSVVDWAPIRLFGRPILSARSEPYTTVLARVSGAEYGPVKAGKSGRVELRILAPPGVSEAKTVARNALGNERIVAIKLGVPAVHESFAICPSASEGLFYFAVDATGAARKNLNLKVESALGQLSPPQLTDTGYYTSSLALPPDVTLGQSAGLAAQIEGEVDSRVLCDLTVAGEAPEQLQLRVTPQSWTAGSAQLLRVQAQARYAGKRTPRAVPLQVVADFGEPSAFRLQNSGLYTSAWRLPARLEGRRQAKLRVQTVGPRPVRAELVIELRPGPPSVLKLATALGRLRSDGHSETVLTAQVFDAYGNPSEAIPEAVEANGTVSRFTAVSTGTFTATYRAPRSPSLDEDVVVVGVGRTTAVGRVRIGLTPPSDRIRLWAAIGYGTNFAKVHAPMGALGVGVRLPVLREGVIIGVDGGYLASQVNEVESTGTEAIALKTTVVPVLARAVYELRVHRFSPYLGVAGGLGMLRLDISSPSSGRATAWHARPAFAGLTGTLVRLGPGSVLLEAAYRRIPVSEPMASGNAGGLAAMVGYVYER